MEMVVLEVGNRLNEKIRQGSFIEIADPGKIMLQCSTKQQFTSPCRRTCMHNNNGHNTMPEPQGHRH